MSRDLPLDAAAGDTGDHAGDGAYRVATGVARVARAGAYVMGGALIASGSDDGPAIGDSQDESRVAGWSVSSVRDPQPNAPSPVITYPDPTPDPGHQPAPSPSGDPIPPGFWVHIEIDAGPGADTNVPGIPDLDRLPGMNDIPKTGVTPGLGVTPGIEDGPGTGHSGGNILPGTGDVPGLGHGIPGLGNGIPNLPNFGNIPDFQHGIPGLEHGVPGLPATPGIQIPGLNSGGASTFGLPGLHPAAAPIAEDAAPVALTGLVHPAAEDVAADPASAENVSDPGVAPSGWLGSEVSGLVQSLAVDLGVSPGPAGSLGGEVSAVVQSVAAALGDGTADAGQPAPGDVVSDGGATGFGPIDLGDQYGFLGDGMEFGTFVPDINAPQADSATGKPGFDPHRIHGFEHAGFAVPGFGFDGIGDGSGVFAGVAAAADAPAGADGAWLGADPREQAGGEIGQELDHYAGWLVAAAQQFAGGASQFAEGSPAVPGSAGAPGAGSLVPSTGVPGSAATAVPGGAPEAVSTTAPAGPPGPGAAVPVAAQAVPVSVVPTVSVPVPAPVIPAPVAASSVAQPVVPAPPVAPVAAAPAVAALQPVVTTPLQTDTVSLTHPIVAAVPDHGGAIPLGAAAAIGPAAFLGFGATAARAAGSGTSPAGHTTPVPHPATVAPSTIPHVSIAPIPDTAAASPSHAQDGTPYRPSIANQPGASQSYGPHPGVKTTDGSTSAAHPGWSGSDSTTAAHPSSSGDSPTAHPGSGGDSPTSHPGSSAGSATAEHPGTSGHGTGDPATRPSPTGAGASASSVPTHDSAPSHESTPSHRSPWHDSSPGFDGPSRDMPNNQAPTYDSPNPIYPHEPSMPGHEPPNVSPGDGGQMPGTHMAPHVPMQAPPTFLPGPQFPMKPIAHVMDSNASSLWTGHDGLDARSAGPLSGGLFPGADPAVAHIPLHPVPDLHTAL